jgi:hypothetical protein
MISNNFSALLRLNQAVRSGPPVIVLMMLAFAGLCSATVQPDAGRRNAAIAARRVDAALSAISLGFVDEARNLLTEALAFHPTDSDANYLQSVLLMRSGEPRRYSMDLLERALAGSSFRRFERSDAELVYAGLLAMTLRPAAALALLADKPRDPERLHAELLARHLLDDLPGQRALVSEALTRYPMDLRLALHWLSRRWRANSLPAQPADSADTALVAMLFRLLPSLGDIDIRMYLFLAPYAAGVDQARSMIRVYRSMGGQIGPAAVLSLRYGLIDEDQAIRELLNGAYRPEWLELVELYGLLSNDQSRERMMAAFGNFSGVISHDQNNDGLPETLARYVRGSIVSWALDEDQDGLPNMTAAFAGGEPRSVDIQTGQSTMRITYDSWPYAATVEVRTPGMFHRYHFGPATLPIALLAFETLTASAGAPIRHVRRSSVVVPAERTLVALAHRVERQSDSRAESMLLHEGIVQRSWWHDGFGSTGMVLHADGLPADERLDLTGDGYHEARRVWLRGLDGLPYQAYIDVDLDGDGFFDYREGLIPPFRRSWDLDGDGLHDLAMESGPDGTIRYEYPSRPGGPIDRTVLYREGQPIAAWRDGQESPLQADSGGRITWIGVKPFDFGLYSPTPGIGSQGAVRYAVREIGGRLFAEILDW